MRVLHKLVIIGIVLGLVFIPVAGSSQAQDALRRQVLYINSYHRGYKFSDDITQGIEAVLKAPGSNIDLLVEYMDTKRLGSAAYMEELARLYKTKYGGKQLDLIISSDDAALNFLFTYADELFPGVPVVFCGANYFDVTRLAGFERFTGVSELADVQGTLDLALSLHPQTTQIAVVNDTTVTGQRVHEKLIEVAASYPNITFIYLEDISMAEVRQRVGQLTPDSLVLVTIFSRDATGEFFEYDVFTPLISESSAVPVYGTWDFSLGYGIVGGKLTSGVTEGERVAQLATRILSGERPQDIPVVQEPAARYMFDYEQLQHWGIPDSILPEDSVIINRPFSFFEQYAQLVWVVGISFVVLSTAVAVLAFNMVRRRRAEVQLTHSLVELQEIRASLEDRVQERTEAFQQRAARLEAAAEVSRATTEMIDVDVLLPQVVELVRQRFNLYYVGLFLIDETGKYAVLRAGTGDPGREMMARGWQLEVGGQSMIGRCVASGQADIQLDVGEAAVHFDNPYLLETHSEMALPLRAGGQTLGAMTVQSDQKAFFSPEDITVLQTVADQVANAVRNARLFQQLQESADAERRAYGELTREAWLTMLQSQSDLGFVSDRHATVQNADIWRPEMETALSSGRIEQGQDEMPTLAIPIKVRDQVVGVVDGRKPDGTVWSGEEIGLLQALTEQLSAALEGAQLYRESQSAALREQLFSQVSGRIREELDLEAVLKTAVDQIQEVLGLDRAAIRLVRDASGLQVAQDEQAGEYHD